MTAPIQEPTIYRHASGLQWGQNQLFRRPAPPSNNDRPWARVSKPFEDGTFYPDQTVSNNSLWDVEWEETYNMGAGESGEGYFDTVGSPITALRVLVQGVYLFTAETYWLEANTFPWNMNFGGDGSNWLHRVPGYYDTFGSTDTMGMISMMHRYEANTPVELQLYQRSGGNRTLQAAYMEAVYLGSWTGPAFNDILPDQ